MRVSWLNTLLLVAISLPPDSSAAPCSDRKCSLHSFFNREAAAAIPPIVPLPKPVVPVINPFPITPKPITPKPITPKPISPKPVPPKPAEPARPNPGSGVQCKRAPGDPCTNIVPFQSADLEGIRNKGRIAQADLVATQRANPPAQDVDRVDVSARYERSQTRDTANPPLEEDEVKFIVDNHLPIAYSKESNWIMSGTRNKVPGPNVKPEDNILVTYTNPGNRGIVISESFNKKYDSLKEPERVRWSDMVMFDLETAFRSGGTRVDELQYMIRSTIQGGESAKKTREYIHAAITHTGGRTENVNTFRSDPYAPGIRPEELAAYQLLAGSDHVHRVILMLKDYPATLRNFRIESLSVTTDKTVGADALYNIIIKFTRVENP